MTSSDTSVATVMKVVDALDHPHGNRILRTRVLEGEPPTVSQLQGARLIAEGPDESLVELEVAGFPLFGGEPTDARIRSTGRVDLVVTGEGDLEAVSRTWRLRFQGR